MDLTSMRSLLAVADHGSIGDAATAMGLSQPAMSRRIRLLEEDLGGELVERSGRGIALTELGRLAVHEGRALVERMDRLKQDIQRHVRLEAGVVRVGAGATAVGYVLPQAIANFRRAHPEVRFDVREAGSLDIERCVLLEEVELGLITLPASSSELEIRPLVRDRIVLVAGRRHPLAGGKRIRARQLNGHSLIAFEAGSQIRRLVDGALTQADARMHVVMELRSISAILTMVETTDGLAFVSELGCPRTRPLAVSDLRIERQLALVHKRGRPLSPAASAFADSLRAAVSGR